jgi:hypothetical protein
MRIAVTGHSHKRIPHGMDDEDNVIEVERHSPQNPSSFSPQVYLFDMITGVNFQAGLVLEKYRI